MDEYDKWKLQYYCRNLTDESEYKQLEFTPEELEANVDAWNQFFAGKGLSDPSTVKAVKDVISIIGRNIVYRSKDDQFYAPFYLRREAENPPLQKAEIMKKSDSGKAEYWSGDYAAKLSNPEEWPASIRSYTSCNSLKYGPDLFKYDDPAKLGLTYYKLSNFQIEAAKIAIEVIEYFKKLYGQDLPKQEEDK